MLTKELTNGVVIGLLLGFRDGKPLVVFPSNRRDHALEARSLAALSNDDIGSEVALLFEDGNTDSPLIVGRILETVQRGPDVADPVIQRDDDDPIKITSARRLELRCGEASIVLKSDGTVTIRGKHILTQAKRANRIQGATVQLN